MTRMGADDRWLFVECADMEGGVAGRPTPRRYNGGDAPLLSRFDRAPKNEMLKFRHTAGRWPSATCVVTFHDRPSGQYSCGLVSGAPCRFYFSCPVAIDAFRTRHSPQATRHLGAKRAASP
jgi:hypothetical protein